MPNVIVNDEANNYMKTSSHCGRKSCYDLNINKNHDILKYEKIVDFRKYGFFEKFLMESKIHKNASG